MIFKRPDAMATVALTVLLLQGCTTAPYVDARREAGKRISVGPSNADMVAICYGGGQEPPPDAVKLAESECAKTGRVPHLELKTRFACTLLAPTRAYFRCGAAPASSTAKPGTGTGG